MYLVVHLFVWTSQKATVTFLDPTPWHGASTNGLERSISEPIPRILHENWSICGVKSSMFTATLMINQPWTSQACQDRLLDHDFAEPFSKWHVVTTRYSEPSCRMRMGPNDLYAACLVTLQATPQACQNVQGPKIGQLTRCSSHPYQFNWVR